MLRALMAAALFTALAVAAAVAFVKRTVVAVFLFNFVLALCTLPAYLAAKCGGVLALCRPRTHAALQRKLVFVLTTLGWRVVFGLCCWVRVHAEGLEEFRSGFASSGRPAVLVANHLSFLDTILIVSIMPLSNIHRVRMFVSGHLLKMPVIGTIVRAMGHVAVPFRKTEDVNSFEVDKDLMAKRMEELEAYVKAGGIAGWFPEGRTNPGDTSEVGVFRAGGFAIPMHVDCEIWCVAFAGNADCWPRNSPVGGRPSRVGVRVFRLCASSLEYAKAGIGHSEDEKAACRYIADTARAQVQAAVTELYDQGYAVRRPPGRQPLINGAAGTPPPGESPM